MSVDDPLSEAFRRAREEMKKLQDVKGPTFLDRHGLAQVPITNLVLHCPKCQFLHLDVGEWHDRPHKKHLCLNEKCGHIWQPGYQDDLHTRGISPWDASTKELADSLVLLDTGGELKDIVAGGRSPCGHLAIWQRYEDNPKPNTYCERCGVGVFPRETPARCYGTSNVFCNHHGIVTVYSRSEAECEAVQEAHIQQHPECADETVIR